MAPSAPWARLEAVCTGPWMGWRGTAAMLPPTTTWDFLKEGVSHGHCENESKLFILLCPSGNATSHSKQNTRLYIQNLTLHAFVNSSAI